MSEDAADLLRRARERRAFDPSPSRAELPELHVPFDRLDASGQCEEALQSALRRGERVALVGGSGSGKSSVVSYVLGPTVEGLYPLYLPVSTESSREVATEPVAFAAHVTHVVRQQAESLDRSGSMPHRTRERTHRLTAGVGIPGTHDVARLGYELKTVVGEPTTTGADQIAQVGQVLDTVRAHDLTPVLWLDDTDKWLSRPSEHEARARRDGFFGSVVRLIAEEWRSAAVVAVHPTYLGDPAYVEAQGFLSSTITVPWLHGVAAAREVLVHRARLAVTPLGEEAPPQADEMFDEEAIAALFDYYAAGEHSDVRQRLLLVAHAAVAAAADQGAPSVTEQLLETAIAEMTG